MIFLYDIPHDDQPKGIVIYDNLKNKKVLYLLCSFIVALGTMCGRGGKLS
jgi:hypothetical protein